MWRGIRALCSYVHYVILTDSCMITHWAVEENNFAAIAYNILEQ